MGNGHHGARVFLKKALQPQNAFGVEVVGGLIEQQQVGMAQQEATQRHAACFATRECGDIGVVRWATQCVHGDFNIAVEAPCISSGNFVFEVGL